MSNTIRKITQDCVTTNLISLYLAGMSGVSSIKSNGNLNIKYAKTSKLEQFRLAKSAIILPDEGDPSSLIFLHFETHKGRFMRSQHHCS